MAKKTSAENFKPEGLPETPFQKAKQIWDERIGAVRVQAKNWRLLAFGCIGLSVLLIFYIILDVNRSRVVPYVIEVDKAGSVRKIGRAEVNYKPGEAVIGYFIRNFVLLTRSLPTDKLVIKKNWTEAYGFLSQKGAVMMNEYMQVYDPAKSAGRSAITVDINSCNKVSDRTFQVEWTENTFALDGSFEGAKKYSGMYTVVFIQPKDEMVLNRNPLGIYVEFFNIQEKFR